MFSKQCEQVIEKIFHDKINELPVLKDEIVDYFDECETDMVWAMKYLYASMPISDIGNYSFDIISDFAANGIRLWNESPFVSEYSEDIFLNYVLYHRVNNEEIAPCRSLFYEQLKEWIHGKTAKEVALEVNYWCAKEATYQSSDERTLSALAVYQSGAGRCGEESTFLVNALRSVGLPARQVYAPRWSHCDDNHAWVEVLIEGKWMFMGACEPEEILNRGWFTSASSRAMVINSKWFSPIQPVGEVVERNGMVKMENQTERYAVVKPVHILVKDEQGNAVSSVKVECQVLNYSEFITIAEVITDDKGHAAIHLGLGCILLYAVAGDKVAECIWNVENDSECTLVLKNKVPAKEWIDFDMIAPKDAPLFKIHLSEEIKKAGQEKLAVVTKKRLEKTTDLANKEIVKFLAGNQDDLAWRNKMLISLSQKDRCDCKADILEEHLLEALPYSKYYTENIFLSYILCPRIQYEPLTLYRRFILEYFTEEEKNNFKNNPIAIWDYISNNIRQKRDLEYDELITTPAACLQLKIGSKRSCNILFVAIARTLGIPARLNPMDENMEFYVRDQFVPVLSTNSKTARLLFQSGDTKINWNYFNNWTIAKYEKGHYRSLQLSNFRWNAQGELSIMTEPGEYRIITSNRLPNGNIFAKSYVFILKEGEEKKMKLLLREAVLEDMLENIHLFPFDIMSKEGEKVSAEELTKDQKTLLMFLEESKEPTEHILNELIERKEEFSRCSARIVFVLRNTEALTDPTLSKCLEAIPGIELYYDDFSDIISALGRKMYVDPDKLPLIIVTNQVLNGIYATSGYNVGTADLLLRILE